jgi:hypothetical protein
MERYDAMPLATPPDNTGRTDPDGVICSAQKCREAARWAVVWNNPKIHTPDREKVWAACDLHRDTLSEYLTHHRMNLIRVEPLGSAGDVVKGEEPHGPTGPVSPDRLLG